MLTKISDVFWTYYRGSNETMSRKKPSHLNLLDGSYENNPERLKKADPVAKRTNGIAPPDWLSDEAKAEWDRICAELDDMAVLTGGERSILIQYCQAFGDWKEQTAIIQRDGILLEGKLHPLALERRRNGETVIKLLGQLGGSPLSRSKISIDADHMTKDDKKEKFLA